MNRIAYSIQLEPFLLEGCGCTDMKLHSLRDSGPRKKPPRPPADLFGQSKRAPRTGCRPARARRPPADSP